MDSFRLTVFFGVFGDGQSTDLVVTVGSVERAVLTGHSQIIQTPDEPVVVAYEFLTTPH